MPILKVLWVAFRQYVNIKFFVAFVTSDLCQVIWRSFFIRIRLGYILCQTVIWFLNFEKNLKYTLIRKILSLIFRCYKLAWRPKAPWQSVSLSVAITKIRSLCNAALSISDTKFKAKDVISINAWHSQAFELPIRLRSFRSSCRVSIAHVFHISKVFKEKVYTWPFLFMTFLKVISWLLPTSMENTIL